MHSLTPPKSAKVKLRFLNCVVRHPFEKRIRNFDAIFDQSNDPSRLLLLTLFVSRKNSYTKLSMLDQIGHPIKIDWD